MSICRQMERLVPLYVGGELPEGDAMLVRAHLATCTACRELSSEHAESISLIKQELASDVMLPALTRRRIALRAAQEQEHPRLFQRLTSRVAAVHSRPGFLAASAALVLAAVALPVALQNRTPGAAGDAAMALEVVADAQGVRLAWSNGSREAYTVYKSDDPREFSTADSHIVHGNIWIDERPESAAIVYYKIE